MGLRAGLLGCLILACTGAGTAAADPGHAGLVPLPYGPAVAVTRQATVVPACSESHRIVLMRCVPRREIHWPDDLGLIQIERSLGRRGPLPYRQLFTWP